MKFQGDRSEMTMEEIFAEVLTSRELDRDDRCRLREALLANSLSEEHHDIINRLIYGTKRRKLKLRD
ncbi:MAG: hypothetical protein F6J93_20490 [Oscillatoria sp. SIO1A7]|nr:hypothetical protein [Oscillatoria sp. SIO1A7]